MKRSVLSLLATAAAISAIAQEAAQRVTFTSKAAAVKQVVQELGKAAGVPMDAATTLSSEIVIISVKDAPLSEVMQKIADVCSAEWQQNGEVYMLQTNAAMRRNEANAEAKKRLQQVQEALASLKKRLDPPAEKGEAGDEGGQDELPGLGRNTGVTKILLTVDPAVIAGIPRNGRVVFSSAPNRMQRPLPRIDPAIVQELVDNHNRQVQQYQSQQGTQDEQQQKAFEWLSKMGLMPKPQTITAPPAKVLLVLQRETMLGTITAQLKLYDAQGRTLLVEQEMLPMGDGMLGAAMAGGMTVTLRDEEKQEEKKEIQIPGEDGKISFSEETLAMMKAFSSFQSMAPPKLPPNLEKALADPASNDPLSFAESESLLSVAQVKDWDVVANLSDEQASFFGMVLGDGGEAQTVNGYLKVLLEDETHVSTMGNGWFVVKPANPIEVRRTRMDRGAMSRLIARVKANGFMTLADAADYALKNEAPTETPAAMIYTMMFVPGLIASGISGMVDWDMLRLYGTFTPAQLSGLRNGTPVRIGSLSADQSGLVSQMVFGAPPKLQRASDQQRRDEDPFSALFSGMMGSFMGGNETDFLEEPTEALPNGLVPGGIIELRLSQEMIVKPEGEALAGMMGMNTLLGADEIAMMRYFMEQPMFAQMASSMPKIDEVSIGEREQYRFLIRPRPEVVITEVLNDDKLGKDAKKAPWDKLPADLQTKVDEKLAAFKKAPFPFFDPSFFGGRRQDPPAP